MKRADTDAKRRGHGKDETPRNISVHVNTERCARARLDPVRVDSLTRRLRAVAKEARRLDLKIFGAAGHGELRATRLGVGEQSVVAELGFGFDGGEGDCADGAPGRAG